MTEIGSKGLSLASDAASKGYDVASTTLLKANNYSPVSGSNYSPGGDWGDVAGQPIEYDNPTETKATSAKDVPADDWDTWGEPASTNNDDTKPAADLEDKWDEF